MQMRRGVDENWNAQNLLQIRRDYSIENRIETGEASVKK